MKRMTWMALLMISAAWAADLYIIEVADDDELFVINGEVFKAQTYCMGWEEGDEVIFIEGSPFGACAMAKLYNKTRDQSCNVWCE